MNINNWLRANPRPCKYGAPMGASDWRGDPDEGYKFYLQRLQFQDYAYTLDGTYWGGPANLYCAWAEPEEGEPVRMFVRAKNRTEAKSKVLEDYAAARFFR